MRPHTRVAPDTSLLDLARNRGRALCSALGLESRSDELMELCSRLTEPWGRAAVQSEPEWRSHVVDDGTPFEYSVAFGKEPELRLLIEPLGSPPSLLANIRAGRALLASLAKDYDVDLSRFERIAELFLPKEPRGQLGIWLAVALSASSGPQFKLYLNPQASGAVRAPELLEEALVRLGFGRAWPVVGNVLAARGPVLDELKYFSLDLSATPEARVKVYARHHISTPEVIASAAAGCPSADPKLIRRFLAAVSPDRTEFHGRGPFTCYAFVEGHTLPDSVTTHFPINGYAENDEVVSRRVRACLEVFSMPKEPYVKALTAIADRPLAAGIGLNSYVSFRHHKGQTRITLYLPSEAYAPGTVENPRARHASGVSERVSGFAGLELERHPFVARLLREPYDPSPLLHLIRSTTLALEDLREELRTLAVELQTPNLSDLLEMFVEAPADHAAAQLDWLADVAAALPVAAPTELHLSSLEAGRRFRERLRESRRAMDAQRRVGAAFASALFAGEVCNVVGRRLSDNASFTRLPTLRGPMLPPWSSTKVPDDAHIDVFAGVTECSAAAWTLLNELYRVCYVNDDEPSSGAT